MRRKEGNGSGASTEITFVWPILAGKEEEWRRALQELEGSRSADFGQMRQDLGIDTIRVWLQRTRYGELAVVYLKVDDAAEAILLLADSEGTFEKWLKRRVEALHGVVVTRAGSNTAPELVFSTKPEKQRA